MKKPPFFGNTRKDEWRAMALDRESTPMPSMSGARRRAFSVVELLTVIAIMAIMLVLASSLTGSMRKAGDLNKAILNISLLLEQAQAYAMAHNTYVWVGFHEDTAVPRLTMAAVAGNTGSAADLDDGAWRPVIQPQKFDHVLFHEVSGLSGMKPADAVEASEMPSYQLRVGGATVTFQQVMQFGPLGGVCIKSDENSRRIQLGLRPAPGPEGDPNVVALQVAGLTGQIRIFRP